MTWPQSRPPLGRTPPRLDLPLPRQSPAPPARKRCCPVRIFQVMPLREKQRLTKIYFIMMISNAHDIARPYMRLPQDTDISPGFKKVFCIIFEVVNHLGKKKTTHKNNKSGNSSFFQNSSVWWVLWVFLMKIMPNKKHLSHPLIFVSCLPALSRLFLAPSRSRCQLKGHPDSLRLSCSFQPTNQNGVISHAVSIEMRQNN